MLPILVLLIASAALAREQKSADVQATPPESMELPVGSPCPGPEVYATLANVAEVDVYDPRRSAAQDIAAAQDEAKRTGKLVLLELGGDWCVWCHILDRTFQSNPELLQLRQQKFILVKVNVSPENQNKDALKRFGSVPGYPYLIVLDADGKLVKKQSTADFESGRGYDIKRIRKFLEKYAPRISAEKRGS